MPRPHLMGVGCCSEIADGPDRKCASREKLLHWLSARHDLPFEGTRSHRSGAEAEARRSFAQHTARCNSDGGSFRHTLAASMGTCSMAAARFQGRRISGPTRYTPYAGCERSEEDTSELKSL